MKWKGLFGVVAVGVGIFFLYAAWGDLWDFWRHGTFFSATGCAVGNSDGVHFSQQWFLEYHNICGGAYDYFWLYFLGFTVIGAILIGGGTATLRELTQ